MDDKLLTAVIAAGTSLVTALLTFFLKPLIDNRTHKGKIRIEHEYEQRKKIKEVLSKYKIHLINSAESLQGRISNLSHNYHQKWHYVNDNYKDKENYYFQSMIYRILNFYAWIKIIESKIIYLDTTIATAEDLNFIKYMRAMRRTIQKGSLVKGLQVDPATSNDLIFRDTLDEMCIWMIKEDDVISFSEFKDSIDANLKKYRRLCEFIDGINPNEDRRRWDRLYLLQFMLMAFINSYGYDFQFSNQIDFEKQLKRQKKVDMFENGILHFKRYKLENEKNIKKLIDLFNKHSKENPIPIETDKLS